MDGRADGCADPRMVGVWDGDGWMDGWMEGLMEGWREVGHTTSANAAAGRIEAHSLSRCRVFWAPLISTSSPTSREDPSGALAMHRERHCRTAAACLSDPPQ